MKKQIDEKEIAKASGMSLPISTKQSIEVCNFIRNKTLEKAKAILERVLEKKEAIPFKRFGSDTGHKKGPIGAGRYPQKTVKEILKILNSVESNAQVKGLNTDDLKIIQLIANKASTPWRFGRKRRRKSKKTHIEIIVKSKEIESKVETKKEIKKEIKEVNKIKQVKKEVQEDKKSLQSSASQNKEEKK